MTSSFLKTIRAPDFTRPSSQQQAGRKDNESINRKDAMTQRWKIRGEDYSDRQYIVLPLARTTPNRQIDLGVNLPWRLGVFAVDSHFPSLRNALFTKGL
jgi:hypothetical protein